MRVFEVGKDDLHRCCTVEEPPAPLQPGQARAEVDAFGLTANNITYAVFGEMMAYWTAYPAGGGWGRVPAWGYATVVESAAEGVPEGARYYGFLPMATEVVFTVAKADDHGFREGSAHRSGLAGAYNSYTRADGDPAHQPDRRAHQMILRPLFFTGFLIEDLFHDQGWWGAQQVILSSASSKTALSTAFLLHQRGGVEVVGLTSPGNVGFCESLGTYERVLTYDQVDQLPVVGSIFVDMAGNNDVRAAVHQHLGDELRHSAVVGNTHWDAETAEATGPLPGAPPTFFFAPDRITARTADWGTEGLATRVDEAWDAFVQDGTGWLEVVEAEGAEEVERIYLDLLDGKADPKAGFVLSL
jgi:hypothetical protein